MVDHKAIIDAERHEVKGASTATIGHVLKANGDTTTSFAAPSTLINTVGTVILSQGSVATQNPAGLDTPLQVNWGAATSNADMSLAANGTVTLTNAGYYIITFNLNFGRTSAAGEAYLFARLLINDVPTGFVQSTKLPDDNSSTPLQINFESFFGAGTTIKVQLIRDSLGINNGGLLPFDPVTAGWDTSPSAWIRIRKVAGAS